MKVLLYISTILMLSSPYSHEKAKKYFENYKEIAISEMKRTGIPASIKLSQALLESRWGESELAQNANNHFGIKCGSSWIGGTYYIEDDDYKNGKLIKSCFRKYSAVAESFISHSEFLTTQSRYQFLFEYDKSDYKSWAKGLRKAGYATDPKYPEKLIKIIEKYELWRYDEDKLNSNNKRHESPEYTSTSSKEVDKVNVEPKQGTTAYRKPKESKREIKPRSKKASNSRKISKPKYHIVKEGETLQSIARKYGMSVPALCSKNRLPLNAVPNEGEQVALFGLIHIGRRIKFTRSKKQEKFLIFE